jgi:hypothetical protein
MNRQLRKLRLMIRFGIDLEDFYVVTIGRSDISLQGYLTVKNIKKYKALIPFAIDRNNHFVGEKNGLVITLTLPE